MAVQRPALTFDAGLRAGLARLLLSAARGEELPPRVNDIDRELYRGWARFGAIALVVRNESGKLGEFVAQRHQPLAETILDLIKEASVAVRAAVSVDLLLVHDLGSAAADPTIRAQEANAVLDRRVAAFIPSEDPALTMLLTPFHLDLVSPAPAVERGEALEALVGRLHPRGWKLGSYARLHCRFTADRCSAYAFDVVGGALRVADDELWKVLEFAGSIDPETKAVLRRDHRSVPRANADAADPDWVWTLGIAGLDPGDRLEHAKLWATSDRAMTALGNPLAHFETPSLERVKAIGPATVAAAIAAGKLEGDADRPTQPVADSALHGLTELVEIAVTSVCEPPVVAKVPPQAAQDALNAAVCALQWLQDRCAGPRLVAARQPTVRVTPSPRRYLPNAVPSPRHGVMDCPSGPYRHFRLLERVDVAPLLAEIEANQAHWTKDTSRQRSIRMVHQHTQTIKLREAAWEPSGCHKDWHGIRLADSVAAFPIVHRWGLDLAERYDSEMGWFFIVRLRARSPVLPHYDTGEYYAYRNRYHLVLQSQGSIMISGSERVTFMPGELWFFDNLACHEAINEGDGWRVHLIFDMKPNGIQLPLDADVNLPGVRYRTIAPVDSHCTE